MVLFRDEQTKPYKYEASPVKFRIRFSCHEALTINAMIKAFNWIAISTNGKTTLIWFSCRRTVPFSLFCYHLLIMLNR